MHRVSPRSVQNSIKSTTKTRNPLFTLPTGFNQVEPFSDYDHHGPHLGWQSLSHFRGSALASVVAA